MGYTAVDHSRPSALSSGTVNRKLHSPLVAESGRTDGDRFLLDVAQGLNEKPCQRKALGERDPNLAHAHAYLGTDLQQPGADGAALGTLQLGALQPETAQGAFQNRGQGAEVQP